MRPESMLRRARGWSAAAMTLAVLLSGCALRAPQRSAQDTVSAAQQAMGGSLLKTLQFSASGTGAIFGQAYQPDLTWPKLNVSLLARQMDYEHAALREDYARSRAEPAGGGAVPLMGSGEQRGTSLLLDTFAWNLAGENTVNAPVALDQRIHDLWTTPHGVLKAAARNNPSIAARTVDGKPYTAVSFTEAGRFSATVLLNRDLLVERIESRLPHPVLGDTDVVTVFSDYRDHDGVKFPARIRQWQGGFEVYDLVVNEVKVNPAMDIQAPETVRSGVELADPQAVAPGVWFITGGTHNSVAIEMRDHVVLVESPLYDGRAEAVFAQVKRVIPGKPIRYVINSHHHFDHAGGLRAAVAEGATLVTSAAAKPFYEHALTNPNGLHPDLLALSNRRPTLIGVSGKHVLSDGARNVEIHEMRDSLHATGFLMVALPKERLLIEADAFTPSAPGTPPPATANLNHMNLLQNIERLQLGVDKILPLHGRAVPLAELYTAVGKAVPAP